MTNLSIKLYGFITGILHREEEGQDLIEYALLGGLIAVAIVAAIVSGVLTDAIDAMATGIADCIDFDDLTNCT